MDTTGNNSFPQNPKVRKMQGLRGGRKMEVPINQNFYGVMQSALCILDSHDDTIFFCQSFSRLRKFLAGFSAFQATMENDVFGAEKALMLWRDMDLHFFQIGFFVLLRKLFYLTTEAVFCYFLFPFWGGEERISHWP